MTWRTMSSCGVKAVPASLLPPEQTTIQMRPAALPFRLPPVLSPPRFGVPFAQFLARTPYA
jgi:hypothetical protein